MLPRARHEYLLRQLELHGSIRASAVADDLGVSQVTVRRDISELDAKGLLAQVHGGALPVRSATSKPSAARTLIGVVVPSATFYYPEVLAGMEAVAPRLRTRLVLGFSNYRPDVERARVERLLALGAEGLVLTPTIDRDQPDDLAAWLESIPVPVVLMERRVDDSRLVRELDSVRTDHMHGALLAVDHFVRLGHRRIALAIFDGTPTARWVRAGYEEAVDHLGLEPGPVAILPNGTEDEEDTAALGRAVDELIESCLERRIHAVLAHSDFHATQIVEIAHLRGLRVPEDLAVISYDDVIAEHAAVPLTAVTPPRRELGRESLRLMAGRVGSPDQPGAPRHVQLLPQLTVRESCGATEATAATAADGKSGASRSSRAPKA
ncbi:substrate-binding domain-containing protein [Georgenia halophila]|uniref:Substrate-binding domain-containing protein n=1 Tax=Georgenia halophila TaxID=620889 RepID=A0ABP8LK00_9MICO